MTLRINLWSGPRNVSTALMYAFAQRSDTRVVDEPLYAHYLRVSGADHPGRDDVLRSQDTDGAAVVRDLVLAEGHPPVLFIKHMAHHLVELDRGFLARCANVILTRDPVEMLPSLVNQIPQPTLRDTGYAMQTELVEQLSTLGQTAPILDAAELLRDPRGVLERLCERLAIAFDPAMLAWKPGARPEDGVWAPLWYQNVHVSTGFAPYSRKSAPFPARLEPLLAQCRPHYERLLADALLARAPTEELEP